MKTDKIENLFGQWTNPDDRSLPAFYPVAHGIAVIMGHASGTQYWNLISRDFDDAESYRRWAEKYPKLAADLPTVETRRGRHVYFRTRDPEQYKRFDDGEFRGNSGHYTIAPPTLTKSGKPYRWVKGRPESNRDFPLLSIEETGLCVQYSDPKPVETGCNRVVNSQPLQIEERQTSSVTVRVESPPFEACAWDGVSVESAISSTVPRGEGQRNNGVFELARRLRTLEPHRTDPGDWKSAVEEWHRRTEESVGRRDFDEIWNDFERAFGYTDHCARRVNDGSYEVGAKEAVKRALQAAGEVDRNEKVRIVCRTLAEHQGGEFFLSCRWIEEVTGIPKSAANRILTSLISSGDFELIHPGTKGKKGLAAKYSLTKTRMGHITEREEGEKKKRNVKVKVDGFKLPMTRF